MKYLRSPVPPVLGAVLFISGGAHAGIPECGNLRLEGVSSCEIKLNVGCKAGCEGLGSFEKVCATKLQTRCRQTDCVEVPKPPCTTPCEETCTSSCDRGENVICLHNCFGECSGTCEAECADAKDPERCKSVCEANCDGECDVQCKPLVEASCYEHCIECCGASCRAQTNLVCQLDCQEEEFESCQLESQAECEISCSAGGALFCDGEFVLADKDVPACVQALVSRGIISAEVAASGSLQFGSGQGGAGAPALDVPEVSVSSDGGCSVGSTARTRSGALWSLFLLLGVGLWGKRRRQSRS